jgi:hypothetical protein
MADAPKISATIVNFIEEIKLKIEYLGKDARSSINKKANKQMASQQPVRRKITIKKEPVVMANGQTLEPIRITDPKSAYRTSMLMLFQHVADIHMAILEIMEEKYGHSVEEMLAVVSAHPKWQDMLVNPMVHDLTAEALSRGSTPASASASSPKPEGQPKKVILRRRVARPLKESVPQEQHTP